jgi:hypothetical protein
VVLGREGFVQEDLRQRRQGIGELGRDVRSAGAGLRQVSGSRGTGQRGE